MTQDPLWAPMTASDGARYVVSAVVSTGVTPQGAPVNPTLEFHTDQQVYLVCRVEGVNAGERHRLSVRWLLDGKLVQVAAAHSSAVVTQNGVVAFAISYPAPGAGLAKVHWDEPVSDGNDIPDDNFLARTRSFTVLQDTNSL